LIAGAHALPTSGQLDLFLDRLRRAEFKFGPNEIAGAQKILLLAHAEADEEGLAARRLKTMLAPIVVRTPTQQADFYRRFDDLMSGLASTAILDRTDGVVEASGARPTDAGPASIGRQSHRAMIAAAAAGLLLLAIAGAVWLFWPPPPPSSFQPDKPSPTISDITARIDRVPFVTATLDRRSGYQAALAGLIALPPFLFAGWMLWRWRRRVLWLERHSGVREADPAVLRLPARDQPLFPAADLTAIGLDLRRHLRVPSRDLDVERTIPETLDAGGSFTPVWQTVPRSPSYLFLVEKESAHDHVAGILDEAVDRLVRENVAVERYHFRSDPRWLTGADNTRIEPMADVAARHGDHRLVVMAGGDGFFEPLSDRLEPGIERMLAQWTPRAVLSTKPMQSWSWRELALVDSGGFDLATASHSGLKALAGRAAAEPDRPAGLLEGVVVSMPARPSLAWRAPGASAAPAPRRRHKSAVMICAGRGPRAQAETRRLAELLEQWAGFTCRVLLDPDGAMLTDALEQVMRANIEPDDTILILVNGRFAHGRGRDGALLLGSEMLPMAAFATLLSRSAAGHQLLIFDGVSELRLTDEPIADGETRVDLAPPSFAREIISALAKEEAGRTLTGLLVEAIEHMPARKGSDEVTFKDLFEATRERDALLGGGSVVSHYLDELNLRYFSTGSASAVMAAAPRSSEPAMALGSVFISYAREDQAAAEKLRDFLEKVGVDVWLDSRQLSADQDWYDESRRQLDDSAFFIPVISANSAHRQDGLFRRQWSWAAERARRLDSSITFIIPVVIDDTLDVAIDIPEEFRRVQWTRLIRGVEDEAFRARILALVRGQHLVLRIISPTEVDQTSIEEALNLFGSDWPIAKVAWPASADNLVSVLRQALDRLERAADLIGSDRFSTDVPPVLTSIAEDRRRAEANIPAMVRRLRNLEQRRRLASVTGFLLYANARIHYSALYHTQWKGLGRLGLEAPSDWAALLQDSPDPIASVLGKGGAVIHVRLRRVAGIDIVTQGGSPGLYIVVPERFAAKITTRPYELPLDELYWWAIPQLEFAATEVDRLPDAYSEDWFFDKISEGDER
jgi:hypothetical protein